ncbi:MAG: hypothetical protein V3V61_01285 [Gammaproteobacteria bacterium]
MAVPIVEGLCSYKDIYTLTIDDFLAMNEIVSIKRYNEEQASAYYSSLSKKG